MSCCFLWLTAQSQLASCKYKIIHTSSPPLSLTFYPYELGLAVKIVHSKTNQFQERELVIALPTIPGHSLCPVAAVLQAFTTTSLASCTGPALAFMYYTPSGLQPLTSSMFSGKLTKLLSQLGYPAGQYSGHSFRRGGASWALECGIPAEVIQILGDWKSQCFMGYLHCPLSSRLNYVQQFSLCLPDNLLLQT